MQHPYKDHSTIQSRRACVGNTFLFRGRRLSFRSRSRSGAMQAREPTPRVSACVCGSSDEGRCDPCAHVGRYFVSFAVAHPHPHPPHRRCSGGKGHPPAHPVRRWGVGFCSMHEAHQNCSSSAPQPLHITLCITPRLLNVTFSFAIPAVYDGDSWRRDISHSRSCSCVTTRTGPCPSQNSRCHQPCPESGTPRMPRPSLDEQG